MKYLHKIIEKYGKYLFGEFRGLNEPDTDEEKEIFNILKTFIKDNKIVDEKMFEKLLNYKEKYRDVLNLEKDNVYRGITLSYDDLKNESFIKTIPNISEFNVEENDDYIVKYGNENTKFHKFFIEYKPKRVVESWTTNLNIALSHADKNNGVILHGSFDSDEMLFDVNFMNSLSRTVLNKPFDEYETLKVNLNFKPEMVSGYISENLIK